MYCGECGTKINENNIYCTECGSRVIKANKKNKSKLGKKTNCFFNILIIFKMLLYIAGICLFIHYIANRVYDEEYLGLYILFGVGVFIFYFGLQLAGLGISGATLFFKSVILFLIEFIICFLWYKQCEAEKIFTAYQFGYLIKNIIILLLIIISLLIVIYLVIKLAKKILNEN